MKITVYNLNEIVDNYGACVYNIFHKTQTRDLMLEETL